jgi:integrase
MVFEWAVDQGWLEKNPMKKIPTGSTVNRDNDRIISMEEYTKLLNACRDQEWRTIIAFARIGGLGCPSELQRLRWSDVKWEENRFLVRSPKTEHHDGHRERLVPLFPELRAELERHFSLDETKDNEFVITRYQNTAWNLHWQFQTIAKRAGLDKIVRPFDNMRMSRSNEICERFGSAKENLWIGHSEMVRRKHYKGELSDEAFAEAAGATKADIDIQVSHAQSHAKPIVTDGKLE